MKDHNSLEFHRGEIEIMVMYQLDRLLEIPKRKYKKIIVF